MDELNRIDETPRVDDRRIDETPRVDDRRINETPRVDDRIRGGETSGRAAGARSISFDAGSAPMSDPPRPCFPPIVFVGKHEHGCRMNGNQTRSDETGLRYSLQFLGKSTLCTKGGDEKPRPQGDGEVDARCDGQGGRHLKSLESFKTARGVLKRGTENLPS